MKFIVNNVETVLRCNVTVRVRSVRWLQKNIIYDVQNAIGSSVDISFNEPCAVYEHLSLQNCYHLFAAPSYSQISLINTVLLMH